MKAAIIGLGVIGKVHYNILNKQGVEVVAICDTDDGVLEKYDGVKNTPIIKRCSTMKISMSCIFARRTICMQI